MTELVLGARGQLVAPWIVGLGTIVVGVVLFMVLAVITNRGNDDDDAGRARLPALPDLQRRRRGRARRPQRRDARSVSHASTADSLNIGQAVGESLRCGIPSRIRSSTQRVVRP
jgi:hypothetical protein